MYSDGVQALEGQQRAGTASHRQANAAAELYNLTSALSGDSGAIQYV